jgi:branched-chain amino acid transport system permease protein
MSVFIQAVLVGIAIGGTYALIGGSFALIYATTRHFHLAHAATFEIVGFGAYALWARAGLPLLLAMVIALLFGCVTAIAYPVVLYPPIQRRSRGLFGIFVVGLGLYIAVDNALTWWLGSAPLTAPVGGGLLNAVSTTGVLTISWIQVIFLGLALLWLAGVLCYLRFSGMGLLTRAYSRNGELIRVLGYRPNTITASVYVLGSLGIGIAAFYTLVGAGLVPEVGENTLLYGFLAAFVTRKVGVTTAFGAGMVIGIGENIASTYVGGDWPTAIIVGAFSLVLLGRSINWRATTVRLTKWTRRTGPVLAERA